MKTTVNSSKGVYYASFTAFLWGFLAIILKVTLRSLSPVEVTWFRFSSAFVLLSVYFLITKPNAFKIFRRPPIFLIAAAACLGMNYFGFITGINMTTPGIAQIFIQLGPVLLALSGIIFFGEKMSGRQLAGFMLVIIGLLVFYREQIMILSENLIKYRSGVLWVMFGAVMWASYAVFQKKLVTDYNPMELNLLLFGLPALGYTPFVNLHQVGSSSLPELILLLVLGINTLLAYGSLAYAFKYLEANKISVIITLNPILTFITMAILAAANVTWISHEKFSFISIMGGALVLAGAILTVVKRSNSLNPVKDK